jgi:putative nucleotidyltransferase with HDIG domain
MNRVLFVDDEPRVLDGLRQSLRSKRKVWDMAFAKDGPAALQELGRAEFDIVISDMRMPGMDGAELLGRVAALQPQAVRIVLSGQMDELAAARAAGVAHRFLAKPCESETLAEAISRALELKQLLASERLRECMGGMAGLPSLPRTCMLLNQALADRTTTLRTVSGIIEQDIGIAAKVLQLVNSSFFGLSRRSTNIEHAVNYLGVNTLHNLVLTYSLFTELGRENVELMEREQQHALLVAGLARALLVDARQAEIASTAGLLHDIGSLALACRLPDEWAANNELARSRNMELHEAERERLGVTHAGMGAYLLGLWGLPHEVIDAVASHHDPWQNLRSLDACAAVHIAEWVAQELLPAQSRQGRLSVPPEDVLERLNLTASVEALHAKAAALVTSGQGQSA